jgi:curved DNA-binding protein
MSVRFKDYYETLGVSRGASQEEIRKTYRRMARQYHPDVNKNAGAENKFKEIAEAYEVLGDPEKRKKYDEFGSNYRAGDEFSPPPGWEASYEFYGSPEGFRGGPSAMGFEQADLGDFSDFFEMLFGGHGMRSRFGRARGEDYQAAVTITLEEAYHGARKTIRLQTVGLDEQGRPRREVKTYNVQIPPGTTDGMKIRLAGQGGESHGEGGHGDLYLQVTIAPHAVYKWSGKNLEITVPITPWEAALGARVMVPTMEGKAVLALVPGTQSGRKLRLKSKGFPGHPPGDLIVTLEIAVPEKMSAEEKRLFEELAKTSSFRPRDECEA